MFRLHIQVRSIDCADQIPPEELVAAITQHWDTGSMMEEYFTLRMSYIFIYVSEILFYQAGLSLSRFVLAKVASLKNRRIAESPNHRIAGFGRKGYEH